MNVWEGAPVTAMHMAFNMAKWDQCLVCGNLMLELYLPPDPRETQTEDSTTIRMSNHTSPLHIAFLKIR